ncbi:hypothetical protein TCAL_03541 [Tigriopus californicus]|uniref:USP domain-containing protein n=2 Tax=Tigriopus californicus TaxID=6832 RepID=A0A553NCM4_TIGCA|nr:hypothetical protein TCAL_03541 [Tigriopus californicus]|eukprot:TCALIF_03541-PA protein Name:"Similar to USP1 Ubiquitin carboxyl-terminal hydrolase 1 (Bos taurus)" AED:0.01 eAED:0.05 QI:0/-1/0/1/-1/1/1/0/819
MAPIDRTHSDTLTSSSSFSTVSFRSDFAFSLDHRDRNEVVDDECFVPKSRQSTKLSSKSKKRRLAEVHAESAPDDDGGVDVKRSRLETTIANMNHLSHHPHGAMGLGSAGANSVKHGIEQSERGPSKFASGTSSASTSLSSRAPSIASLCNLGNTCFLNSVLYTLRFTPGFLHNLHHLASDINHFHRAKRESNSLLSKTGKSKSSGSLQNGHSLTSVNVHSPVITSNIYDSDELELVVEVIDQLHDLFKTLSNTDEGAETRDPIAPSSFLTAVGRLNPLFEGNQQQDAHELLVMILTILEDIKIPQEPSSIDVQPSSSSSSNTNLSSALSAQEIPHQLSSSLSKAPPIPEKKSKTKKSGKFLPNGIGGPHTGGGASLLANGNSHSMPSVNNTSAKNTMSSSNNDLAHIGRSVSPNTNQHTSQGPHKASGENSSASSFPTPNAASPPYVLPNFVKENFEGKSVMRTRCLECEASTYRSETFTNIDVALTFEDEADADELSGKDLFLKQIMMSETLRENNKYWCEECSRLNEAQRSVQFELLPKVMVLQLKRFTAATGSKSSYMSKINDHIPTPFTLNCFCTQCMPHTAAGYPPVHSAHASNVKPRHIFKLYAVIMHLGATLASGHYIAYVKASSDSLWEYQQCQRAVSSAFSTTSSSNGIAAGSKNGVNGNNTAERKKKSIMKFLRKKDDSNIGSSSPSLPSSQASMSDFNHSGLNSMNGSDSLPVPTTCRSVNCCGVRSLSAGMDTMSMKSNSFHHRSIDSSDSDLQSSSSQTGCDPDDLWLECDDETIQPVSRKQFEDILNSRQGATTTPYLLFYQKC